MKQLIEIINNSSKPLLFTCSSEYHVLLTLCILCKTEKNRKKSILMFSPTKSIVNNFKSISARIQGCNIKTFVFDKKTKLHRAVGISDRINNSIKKEIYGFFGSTDYLLINYSWNQQIVRYPASLYYRDVKESLFIEEGATQYVTPNENRLLVFLKRMYGNQTGFWEDNRLESIYVQFPMRYPKYLQRKMRSFNPQDGLELLSSNQKEQICRMLCDDESYYELKELKRGSYGIIFTAPFSEDGYISREEKKRVFGEIADYYSKYGNIVIKKHPRDTSDYNELNNVLMLRGGYPSELYRMMGIRFNFAISMCSSAIETVDADIRFNLNENYLKDKTYRLRPL